jgi:Mrp family chromosome partitioning ATPase/capsular polysaccharide biosynthesis protein
MLDATNRRLAGVDDGDWQGQQPPLPDGGLGRFVENVLRRRRVMVLLILIGAAAGWLASLAYVTVRVSAYTASSEILISNTTLQLSGPDAVVTQILVENTLVENAVELLKSGRVLGRVVDKLGSEEIERISPRSRILPGSPSPEPDSSDVARKQASIALLRANTIVKRVGTSQIVMVSARAQTAADAATLTNEIAGAFVQEQYEANAVVSTSAALRERIKVLGPTARIISEAVPPKSKDRLTAALAMLLGIMLGGAAGAGGGLAWIGFDRRLRTSEQLAGVTSLECFGYVPRIDPQLPVGGVIPLPSPDGLRKYGPAPASANGSRRGALTKHSVPVHPRLAAAPLRPVLPQKIREYHKWLTSDPTCSIDLETFLKRSVLRRVRSAVNERSTSVPHIVGVTSCHAGEGKTMLAGNLARFIARDGTPVLLIDASEMKHGRTQQKAGLHELLRGTAAADDVIESNVCPNLDFLPRGKGSGDLDLLWGNLLHAVGGGREPPYKWVILDLPGLATAVDVRAAGQVLDDLLMVVEWGRTTQGQLQQGLRALGSLQERFIGTIINKVPGNSTDFDTTSTVRRRPVSDEH